MYLCTYTYTDIYMCVYIQYTCKCLIELNVFQEVLASRILRVVISLYMEKVKRKKAFCFWLELKNTGLRKIWKYVQIVFHPVSGLKGTSC